ncbi:MAG TPA: hypothetical protein VMK31_06870 [Sphingomicrobium sp.]|nr:hypothetical protein [Sphingomicrobium sp.]
MAPIGVNSSRSARNPFSAGKAIQAIQRRTEGKVSRLPAITLKQLADKFRGFSRSIHGEDAGNHSRLNRLHPRFINSWFLNRGDDVMTKKLVIAALLAASLSAPAQARSHDSIWLWCGQSGPSNFNLLLFPLRWYC